MTVVNDKSHTLSWVSEGKTHERRWISERSLTPPKRVMAVDDTLSADAAYRLACEGVAFIWQGDFQNARQLLQAMARRIDQREKRASSDGQSTIIPEVFHRFRLKQAQRARTLGALLIPINAGGLIPLRRAPMVAEAIEEAIGGIDAPSIVALTELQGIIGAHEWRKKGVWIEALQASITPAYGVYSPVRGEYLELIAQAPLPEAKTAVDVGCGTAVIAALLAKRGIKQVVASDISERALRCASQNIQTLGLQSQVRLCQQHLIPTGRFDLLVCNPPWLPGKASTSLEQAIYDENSQMLTGFLQAAREHLTPQGEAWLVISDLAERIGLRAPGELQGLIQAAGLSVLATHTTKAQHKKTRDSSDPLFAVRSQETTYLYRLKAVESTPRNSNIL